MVVSIIAMIAGLLTPALMGARCTALDARVKAENDLLHMALMNYKNEYGSFPPANFGPLLNAAGNPIASWLITPPTDAIPSTGTSFEFFPA